MVRIPLFLPGIMFKKKKKIGKTLACRYKDTSVLQRFVREYYYGILVYGVNMLTRVDEDKIVGKIDSEVYRYTERYSNETIEVVNILRPDTTSKAYSLGEGVISHSR